MWNSDKCVKNKCKKHHICENDYIWNPSICNCENGKYSASIMDHSAIPSDEIIEEIVPTNFNEKKQQPVKRKTSILYLHFY